MYSLIQHQYIHNRAAMSLTIYQVTSYNLSLLNDQLLCRQGCPECHFLGCGHLLVLTNQLPNVHLTKTHLKIRNTEYGPMISESWAELQNCTTKTESVIKHQMPWN